MLRDKRVEVVSFVLFISTEIDAGTKSEEMAQLKLLKKLKIL